MAQILIEDVIDHLSSEMRRALEATLEEHFPNSDFDSYEVFRTFKREVYRKCSVWENIPNNLVK